jgi:hypothetical protein
MNSLSSLIRSKTSLALGIYVLAFASLFFLVDAQIHSMQLLQAGRPTFLR